MKIVHALGGRPFKLDGNGLWNRDGQYVGCVVEGLVFSPAGVYLGEMRMDRLVHNPKRSHVRGPSHTPKMDRSGTTRSDGPAQPVPLGWEDFHG